MKSALYQILSTDAALQALGVTEASLNRGSATESPEHRPFVNIMWGDETPSFGSVGSAQLSVWAYDEPGDYDRIDKIIARVKELVLAAEDVDMPDGTRLTSATWAGASGDLWDDMYACITRNCSFTVAGGIR